MNREILLEARNVSKNFPGVRALDDVHIQVKKGEVHALLGENGAGKSTLIKILGGIYHPDHGEIYMDGGKVKIENAKDAIDLGISIIHQELNLAENMSVAENVFFGRLPHTKGGIVNRKELEKRAGEILRKIGLNIDVNTKVRFLSIAKKQMLEIGKSLSLNARIIIMDEPTSSLCPEEISLLFHIIRELKSQGISIVYISHKLEEIFEICDRITVLRDGKNAGTVETADTGKEQLIKMMVGREANLTYKREGCGSGETVLEVHDLCTDKLRGITFSVQKGEIVGFSGLMGAGKSETARALFGIDPIRGGRVVLCGKDISKKPPHENVKNGMGYIPEDRKKDGLFLNLSLNENMTVSAVEQYTKRMAIDARHEQSESLKNIKKLSIKTPSLKQKIRNLSGGNQQKVIIARWLMKKGLKVLVIDEPTRGIDVGAKFEIYSILSSLAKSGIALLVMSSEIEELTNISDRIVILREGKITAVLNGKETDQMEIMKYSVK